MSESLETLAENVIAAGTRIGKTIGTVESCTGGGLGAALTSIAGSSSVLSGGLITYSNATKINVLGIPMEIVDCYGAVSEPTAEAMASQGRDILGVDITVSITGIAGPGGSTKGKPVGMVCFGLADGGRPKTFTQQFGNPGRKTVRQESIRFALNLLLENLNS